jgi:Fungal chitosanase of glycosyl hydrolase group 75
MFRAIINIVRPALGAALATFLCLSNSLSQTYSPPQNSASLTANLRFADAKPLDEDYRSQFVNCDGNGPPGLKDHFRGHSLVIPGRPPNKQYYLCSRDPSHLGALLRMPDGAVFWQSKMALDVDGSWVAWSGRGGATDQQLTSYTWPGATDKASQAAQLDPDRIPFIVIPNDGLRGITGSAAKELGAEFAQRTGLRFGDMGVVIYRDQWTPVMVGDGGPFMRVGEASSKVFESIRQSRCRGWNSDKSRCIGSASGGYPYRDFGIDRDVLFIVWPNSAPHNIGPGNALVTLCSFAIAKLGLPRSDACPR